MNNKKVKFSRAVEPEQQQKFNVLRKKYGLKQTVTQQAKKRLSRKLKERLIKV